MSWGKKRVHAPQEPPGEGSKHAGKDAQRERREGPLPSRGGQQPAQTWGPRVAPRPEEGGGLAHESVGALTAGSHLLTGSKRPRRAR
jgi:hypothetical protein